MTNTWGNNGNSDRLYFLGLQIAPVDSYYSHKIKTLVAWKKSYDTLRQRIIKKRHHFIDYAKAFDCVDHNKLWNILKEMGIPDHLTCLLRNLYAGQEATVGTGHGTTDWVQIEKGVHQGCILSPCLFNFYAECIMGNARLDEAQAGIKITKRNINDLRYADDTTLIEIGRAHV